MYLHYRCHIGTKVCTYHGSTADIPITSFKLRWKIVREIGSGVHNSLGVMYSKWERPGKRGVAFKSLRPRPNRRHFADGIFKCIFENENEWISPRISLKFVPKVRINNIPASVQIMVWRRPGDKPLSEPMMVSLLTHICVTRQLTHWSLGYMCLWLKKCRFII